MHITHLLFSLRTTYNVDFCHIKKFLTVRLYILHEMGYDVHMNEINCYNTNNFFEDLV